MKILASIPFNNLSNLINKLKGEDYPDYNKIFELYKEEMTYLNINVQAIDPNVTPYAGYLKAAQDLATHVDYLIQTVKNILKLPPPIDDLRKVPQ